MRDFKERSIVMKRFFRDEAGVTLGQFAIVFPLFMLFIVVLIDFGRFSSLKGVVQEGVHRAVERSVTVPNLDIDPRGMYSADVEYQRLKLAREKAAETGQGFISSVGLIYTKMDSELTGINGPQLLDIVFTEDRLSDTPEEIRGKVAILMPGECAFVPKLNHTECNRQTLGTTEGDPAPVEAPKRLIERHPVKAVAFATFDSFTPVLFNRPFKIEQYAYRQPIPQGPFPAFEDPGLSGGYGSPPDPEDNQPLGAVELPDEPVPQCVPDWGECIDEDTIVPGDSGSIPAYWRAAQANGLCQCKPATERP